MKAVVQEKYGSPDDLVVREVANPPFGEGEVRVQVRAAGLHPDVWHVVCGRPWVLRLMGSGLRRPRNPIPGTDLAGVVEAVGAGVVAFRPGDEVFGQNATHPWKNGGALAELVSAPASRLQRKPGNLTFGQAACAPTSGIIALQNLRDPATIRPGMRVLVNGAAGGVGSMVVQIAKASGAHVTAVDSSAKAGMLRALDADEVVDYLHEDFTRRGARYDLVFDVPGNRPFSEIRRALETDGRYVPIGHEHYDPRSNPMLGLVPHFLGLMVRSPFVRQLRAPRVPTPTPIRAMALLRELLERGTIRPIVDRAFPLERVREAFRHMIEDEPRGGVVIAVAEHAR